MTIDEIIDRLHRGEVLRWVPPSIIGEPEENGRSLWLNRTRLDSMTEMDVACACKKDGPLQSTHRDGFSYVTVRGNSRPVQKGAM